MIEKMLEKDRKSFHKFVEQNVSVFNKKVTMADLFRAYRSILSLKDKVMFSHVLNVNFNGFRMKRQKWPKYVFSGLGKKYLIIHIYFIVVYGLLRHLLQK